MQFDDQQQNIDPSGQDNPYPFSQGAGQQSDDIIDEFGNRIPSGGQYSGQARQAAGQGLDPRQQQAMGQGQQGMGNLDDSLQQQGQPGMGGMGEMLGNQSNQPGQRPPVQPASASADPNSPYGSDPNNPYGNVDDVIADYGNTQSDQGQQGLSNV